MTVMFGIRCETPGCPVEGEVFNTVEIQDDMVEAFAESYGSGAEDSCDVCPECGQLGCLQDPLPKDLVLDE